MMASTTRTILEQLVSDLRGGEWSFLIAEGAVAAAEQDGNLNPLAARVQELRRATGIDDGRVRAPRPELLDGDHRFERHPIDAEEAPEEMRRFREPDGREIAVSILLAAHAAARGDVPGFRGLWFPDGLLDLADVEDWLHDASGWAEEGPPRRWIEVELPPTVILSGGPSEDRTGASLSEEVSVGPTHETPSVDSGVRVLLYGTTADPYEHVVGVGRLGGLLDTIRLLSADLARRYRWSEAQATTFLLTDRVPLVRRVMVESSLSLPEPYPVWPMPGEINQTARILLTVDPSASSQEVIAAFRRERSRHVTGRLRPLGEKHLRLALVHAALSREEGWEPIMERWNEEFPEWAYGTVNNFSRDVRQAQRRLLAPFASEQAEQD